MEIILRDADDGRWRSFTEPSRVIVARRVGEVVGALEKIELAVEQDGLTAVGFLSYEAAAAFDSAFRTHQPKDGVPLLCFGLFEGAARTSELPFARPGQHTIGVWRPTQSEAAHGESVRRIRDHIARGDTYQVNHTFRLRAPFSGDSRGLFRDLARSQPESFATYLDLGDLVICSASPELFFRLDGDHLTSKPMKGTAERGWSLETDRAQGAWLEAFFLDLNRQATPVRLGLAAAPVKPEDPFLHFKTTHREVYELARATRPECDDVLLWNDRGEVTESTIANLAVSIDGEFVTPPVECGLLAGTFRAELLDQGEIVERIILVEHLARAESLHLINSVQRWRDVEWVG